MIPSHEQRLLAWAKAEGFEGISLWHRLGQPGLRFRLEAYMTCPETHALRLLKVVAHVNGHETIDVLRGIRQGGETVYPPDLIFRCASRDEAVRRARGTLWSEAPLSVVRPLSVNVSHNRKDHPMAKQKLSRSDDRLNAPPIVKRTPLPGQQWNGLYIAETSVVVAGLYHEALRLIGVKMGDRGTYAYVMSPHSGGQVRWYWRPEGFQTLRLLPGSPAAWPELDEDVGITLKLAVFNEASR